MKPPKQIETERLILRKPKPEDAVAAFEGWAQDTEVTEYLTWQPHQHVEQTSEFIRRCIVDWDKGWRFPYIITIKAGGQVAGMIDPRVEGHKLGIGYALARPYWGKGYMTEATRAIIDWALRQKEIYRVYATTDVENIGSQRVLEKAGMTCEGLLRRYLVHPNISDEPRDCYMYAIVK
jgi:ribosomal-protein-alanine N-acetyltransferase